MPSLVNLVRMMNVDRLFDGGNGPPTNNGLKLEDDVFFVLLEDNTSFLLLEA